MTQRSLVLLFAGGMTTRPVCCAAQRGALHRAIHFRNLRGLTTTCNRRGKHARLMGSVGRLVWEKTMSLQCYDGGSCRYEDKLESMARAIVSSVSALETNPPTGDRTALAVLLGVLDDAERISGFKARRAAQHCVEPTGAISAAPKPE